MLIASLVERWMETFDVEVAKNAGPEANVFESASGYVIASSRMDEATQAKMVGMLLALSQSPAQSMRARQWYSSWLRKFDPESDVGRRARVALFAAEGAFFLRGLGLVRLSPNAWDGIFRDLLDLIFPPAAGGSTPADHARPKSNPRSGMSPGRNRSQRS